MVIQKVTDLDIEHGAYSRMVFSNIFFLVVLSKEIAMLSIHFGSTYETSHRSTDQ